jgi:4-alpha-glucanotransferase
VSDDRLTLLAEAAGIAPTWHDYRGAPHQVSPESLRRVLAALDVAAGTPAEVETSLEAFRAAAGEPTPLITALEGDNVDLPGPWELTYEDGGRQSGADRLATGSLGYHRLAWRDREVTLAVAPRQCHPVPDGRPWGIAAQLYSLRRQGDGGIGDFAALGRFAQAAARRGADAVAISPVHAQFSADPDRFSPYAPSSRIMVNVLHAAADGDAALEQADLVDWPRAARVRLRQLRASFDAGIDDAALDGFVRHGGEALHRHATFEALQAHFYGSDPHLWAWKTWPEAFRHPGNAEVARFAADHTNEVRFHAYLQWRAETGLQDAQRLAREAGMRIGLIADLAVGTDSGGSHAWSRPDEMMNGLAIGAPPDLLNVRGQNWGISAFSPLGLRRHGFGAFIEMLRAALRHAGGIRIDHAMGLARLWVVPDGAEASDGAYLLFPLDDMLRLLALESRRHQAVVLCEDLGTVPEGFSERLGDAGMLGMRVLWFQRDEQHFWPPAHWTRQAVAMTSTHDLPTVAGWWQGTDIGWRRRLNIAPDPDRELQERGRDRDLLWQAMRESGAASGEMPPPHDAWPAVEATLAHIGGSACTLALLPLEDVLGREQQPNLPGTTTQHPNWCRRMPGTAEDLLEPPEVVARLERLNHARGGTA